MVSELVAQGLTDTGGGSGLNLDGLQNWLIGALVAVVGIVVLWRAFKIFLKDPGNDGTYKSAEDHGKMHVNNLANAGITVGVITVAAVIVAWVAQMLMSAVG